MSIAAAKAPGWLVPAAFALLKLAVHLPVLGRYGYHHDELYFLACGKHFSAGYVDHPPLIPWIARLMDELFGRSLFALRLPAVLAGAAAVFITGMLARRLGGGRLSQGIACLAMLVAPVYLRSTTMLTIPAFEPLVWVAGSYLLVRIADGEDPRLWLWLGLVVGIGLLIKHSTLFFAAGLAAGVLLTPMRAHLRSPWPYLAAALAFFLWLPNLVWQASNGWASVEFILKLNAAIREHVNPLTFTAGQLIYLNPVTAPIWITGLVWLFRARGGRYSVLAWIWTVAFALLATAGGKLYYLAPAYPALLAAGGVALGHWDADRASKHPAERRGLLWSSIAALLVGGAVILPVSIPWLSLDTTERYIRTLTRGALDRAYEVTGDLHGQFGWPQRVETVAQVYRALSPEERDAAVIFTDSYGTAAAIDYFGSDYGLPPAFSTDMTYALWGPPDGGSDTLVAVNVERQKLEEFCSEIRLAAQIELADVNPWERRFTVFVCRRPTIDLRELWRRARQ